MIAGYSAVYLYQLYIAQLFLQYNKYLPRIRGLITAVPTPAPEPVNRKTRKFVSKDFSV